jgi:hypothetical protein
MLSNNIPPLYKEAAAKVYAELTRVGIVLSNLSPSNVEEIIAGIIYDSISGNTVVSKPLPAAPDNLITKEEWGRLGYYADKHSSENSPKENSDGWDNDLVNQ